MLKYGFNTMNLDEIVAVCMKENIASRRVMEKIGLRFRYIQQGLPKEYECCNGDPFYSLTKDEYLRAL
jgi:ribosomal-protein-alanine N-acetyltransferase